MTNMANGLNAIYTRNTGVKVTPSYAASSALAKQIETGAPADVFISADVPWMDYVQERKLIKNNTRFDLASNRLVLIAAKTPRSASRRSAPASIRQPRRPRTHRHRRREVGACRPLCPGVVAEARLVGKPPKANSP